MWYQRPTNHIEQCMFFLIIYSSGLMLFSVLYVNINEHFTHLLDASLSSVAKREGIYSLSLVLFLCWRTITSLLWPPSFILCIGLFCKITRKTNSTYFLPMFFCFHFLLLSFCSIWSLLYSKEWGRNPILLYYLFRWQPSCPITIRRVISLFFCIWNSVFTIN